MNYLLFNALLLVCSFSFSQSSISESNELKQILQEISSKAIELGDANPELTKQQIHSTWIGYQPAKKKEIEKAEKRLGISLPQDYVDFLLITNGFQAANIVEPSFSNVSNIDYLINVDAGLYENWIVNATLEYGNKLKTAIKIGGFDEEQHFFLIPPSTENPRWEYWSFSNWTPGETSYHSIKEYFNAVLETTSSFIEIDKNTPKSK